MRRDTGRRSRPVIRGETGDEAKCQINRPFAVTVTPLFR